MATLLHRGAVSICTGFRPVYCTVQVGIPPLIVFRF